MTMDFFVLNMKNSLNVSACMVLLLLIHLIPSKRNLQCIERCVSEGGEGRCDQGSEEQGTISDCERLLRRAELCGSEAAAARNRPQIKQWE